KYPAQVMLPGTVTAREHRQIEARRARGIRHQFRLEHEGETNSRSHSRSTAFQSATPRQPACQRRGFGDAPIEEMSLNSRVDSVLGIESDSRTVRRKTRALQPMPRF